ncbi:DUF4157 domain-containing protein [Candidatus Electronema sp. PJ]|uniref:eCIS core domain-containing protein n=1 Tax=Candidatus Electronema sp. PJ TaxID=3401572 RepID=UPI003AA81427
MTQYADKSNEPERRNSVQQQEQQKSRAAANESVQKRSNSESTFELIDNRPKAVAQRKLIEMANNSPRSKRLAAMQDMANNSPRANKLVQLFGKKESEVEPVQKKGPLDEDELQFKAKEPMENNTGLPDNLKAGVENLSGMAMDDVRVHYNSGKPAQLNAYAYTQGTAIHVAPGQEKHLPHEAWHVVQQKQGRVQPTMQMAGGVAVNDDKGLEKEADGMGREALQMKTSEHCGKPVVQGKRDVIQMMTLYRYGTSGRKETFKPKNPVLNGVDFSIFCELCLKKAEEDMSSIESDIPKKELIILFAAELHAQNNLGNNNCLSPFLSLCKDYQAAAESGTIKEIVENSSNIFVFNIPDERIVKVGNGISYGETEVLVWLRQGESLENYLTNTLGNSYNYNRKLSDIFNM